MENTTFLEISKSYVMKFYDGDLKAAIKEKDGIIFDNDTIISSFGSLKEFERYKNDNSIFCHYISL